MESRLQLRRKRIEVEAAEAHLEAMRVEDYPHLPDYGRERRLRAHKLLQLKRELLAILDGKPLEENKRPAQNGPE